jgi:hypothetical protein
MRPSGATAKEDTLAAGTSNHAETAFVVRGSPPSVDAPPEMLKLAAPPPGPGQAMTNEEGGNA